MISRSFQKAGRLVPAFLPVILSQKRCARIRKEHAHSRICPESDFAHEFGSVCLEDGAGIQGLAELEDIGFLSPALPEYVDNVVEVPPSCGIPVVRLNRVGVDAADLSAVFLEKPAAHGSDMVESVGPGNHHCRRPVHAGTLVVQVETLLEQPGDIRLCRSDEIV